jgi:hypothetical protein
LAIFLMKILSTQAAERNSTAQSEAANEVSNLSDTATTETLLSQLRAADPAAAQEKSKPERLKRIELRATQEFLDVLDTLSRMEGLGRADIIRKAVGLYARALMEARKGRLMAIVSLKDGQIHTEEVFQV